MRILNRKTQIDFMRFARVAVIVSSEDPKRCTSASHARRASSADADPSSPSTIERGVHAAPSRALATSTEHGASWRTCVATLPSRMPAARP